MISDIIFDFDGTLVDSMDLFLQTGNEMAGKSGMDKFTREELMSLNSLSIKERCKKMGIPLYKIPGYVSQLIELYRKGITQLKVFDGINDVIETLRNTYRLSIITSNSESNVRDFLLANKLSEFENIVSSKSIFGKHSTIKNFIKKQNINKQNVIYIGDELRDIIACRKAGIRIISVTWGFDSIRLLSDANPDYTAEEPHDILKIVDNLKFQAKSAN